MTRRRRTAANGEGSLYEEADYGRPDPETGKRPIRRMIWVATYRLDGDHRLKRARGKTRAEAVRARAEAIERHRNQGTVKAVEARQITLAELAGRWRSQVIEVDIQMRTTSQDFYRKEVARFGPLLGLPVVEVDYRQVMAWRSDLVKAGRVPKTVNSTVGTLRRVLDFGVDSNIIPTNPVVRVKALKLPAARDDRYTLSADETARLLGVTDTNRYGAVVSLLFLQGWRISEALGLAWGDIDFAASTADVQRGCHDDPLEGLSLGPVKTGATEGLKLLTPGVIARLQARRVQADKERAAVGEAWPTHRYEGAEVEPVFLTAKGGLVRRQTIDSLMRRAGTSIGLDGSKLGTHVGRRSKATRMRSAGESSESIALSLGQTDVKTTRRSYVQGPGDELRRVEQAASRLLDVPFVPPS